MALDLILALSLIIGGLALAAWGREQWRRASEKARRASQTLAAGQRLQSAQARRADAVRRRDTRDQHSAEAECRAAMIEVLSLGRGR